MNCDFSRQPHASQDAAMKRTTAALAREGLRVLTTGDVNATMRNKFGSVFRPCAVPGAYDPHSTCDPVVRMSSVAYLRLADVAKAVRAVVVGAVGAA